jgi:F420-non-reducing hydrogenase small subunit
MFVVGALLEGKPLPPAGSIVGADNVALCEECSREKREKQITRFYRPYEINPDPDQCLLEQGILCMGIATRAGCGALCPSVGMGCRGCYGPPDGVEDQGAKMLSAIASVIDAGDETMEEDELNKVIQEAVDTIADPAGTFYRFSMSHSILQRVKNGKGAV